MSVRKNRLRRTIAHSIEQLEDRQLMSGGITSLPTTNPPVALVTTLYQEILGRSPDQNGLVTWTNAVNSGTTIPQIANAFWNSAEHKAHPIGNLNTATSDATDSYVNALYHDVLGRGGDQAGISNWDQLLNSNKVTPNQAAMSFWNCSEHQNELKAGKASNSTYGVIVNAAYNEILGRSPDIAGLNTWVNAEYTGGVTQSQIAQSFASSPEFASKTNGLSTDQFVQLAYKNILHRNADANGLATWDQVLNTGGATRLGVEMAFWNSPEHQQEFGIYLSNPHPTIDNPISLTQYFDAPNPTFLWGATGPQYTDVQQGGLGDCWLMAGLGSIVARRPDIIEGMFKYDGTWTINNGSVAFYDIRIYDLNHVARTVTVDTELPNGPYSGGYEYAQPVNGLWVALIEKAYAIANGHGWVSVNTSPNVDSYDSLDAGFPKWLFAAVTGKGSTESQIDAGVIGTDWGNGAIVCIWTTNPTDTHIVGDHAYSVVGYNANSTTPFTINNPWGLNADGTDIYRTFSENSSFIDQQFAWQDVCYV